MYAVSSPSFTSWCITQLQPIKLEHQTLSILRFWIVGCFTQPDRILSAASHVFGATAKTNRSKTDVMGSAPPLRSDRTEADRMDRPSSACPKVDADICPAALYTRITIIFGCRLLHELSYVLSGKLRIVCTPTPFVKHQSHPFSSLNLV